MARKQVQSNDSQKPSQEKKLRGKRKPTEYRFETIDTDGNVTGVDLTLTHQESAKQILAFLNDLPGLTEDGSKFRFTKVVVYQ